jgi:glyoxalase family protein
MSTSNFPGSHQGQPVLSYGVGLETARAVVIMMHGRGASARDILTLAPLFEQTDLAYFAPQANQHTWYPYSFLAPLDKNEPYLSSALQAVDDVLQSTLSAGFDPARMVLFGFSQGACLTLEYAARHPRRYGAIVAFSGGLIGPDDAPRNYTGSLVGTPVFIGGSDNDPHVPESRVHETEQVLTHMGAQVDKRIYPGAGHGIVKDEIMAVHNLLQQL